MISALKHGVICILLMSPLVASRASIAGEVQPPAAALADAIAAARPALVRLSVVVSEFEGGREVRREASGSGFIVTPEGHVLTNHHVAGRASRVQATLPDGRQLDADVVAADPMSDLALVKLRTDGAVPFPTVTFGDSSQLTLGERVLALGSPLGLSQSVTAGIVSNLALVMPREFEIEGEDVGTLVRWIGHDAPIFPGNSGGPLVNLRGEVVGVNDIGFGLGGAIPGNLAREVARALVRDGRVRRSWIGVALQPLLRRDPRGEGALVSGCVPESPAARAGVSAGDVLLRIGDEPVHARTPEDLAPLNLRLATLPIGTPVDLVVRRGDRTLPFRMTAIEREARRAPVEEVAALGFTGSNLTSWHARELRRASTAGVRVDSVRPGGSLEAARPALREGDVIVAVDGADVPDLAALRARLEPPGGSVPASLLIAFERGRERLVTVVQPGGRDSVDRSTDAARAWLPASTQPLLSEVSERLEMRGVQGLLVTRVFAGRSAETAGLRVGDVITAFDDEPITVTGADESDHLRVLARQRRIGTVVPVRVWRGKAELVLNVPLETAPPSARDARRYRDKTLEFAARDLVFEDDEPRGGVKVEEVTPGGWAALATLRTGDVIVAVDGTEMPDVTALELAMRRARDAAAEHVLVLVRRGEDTRFIEMRPEWPRATRQRRGTVSRKEI